MPATKFLCIDDQQGSIIDPLLLRLAGDSLALERTEPIELAQQIRAIEEFVVSARGGPVGLLLDLRLDMEAGPDGSRVAYRGPSLAQELRTRMAEHELPPIPLVLWSVNTKFQQSFAEETAHDLFDAVYGKDAMVQDNPTLVSKQMVALAEGYVRIRDNLTVAGPKDLLSLRLTERNPLYDRFLAELSHVCGTKNVHDVTRFILDYLIRREGLLVGPETLAARLGVDAAASDDWNRLCEALTDSSYTGPFSSAWRRWWWFSVEDWWASISDGKSDLRRLSAEERVSRINKTLSLALVPALPLLDTYSRKFFTVCVATEHAIDPADGLRVMSIGAKEWTDTRYVSIHAALERINKDRWTLDPLDRDRFDAIKESMDDGKDSDA